MRKPLLTLALVALLPAAALAENPLREYRDAGEALAAATLDASSTNFSFTNGSAGGGLYGIMVVWVTITDASNSVTALNMTCTGTNSSASYTLQEGTTAAGVTTTVDRSWTKNPSSITSPKRWPWRVDVEGILSGNCVFTDTGGDASDTIAVRVTFATKGG